MDNRHIDSKLAKLDVEMTKCNSKLDTLITRSESQDKLLYGDGTDDNPGMRIDVDRLKTSRANITKFLWIIVTALVGTVTAVAAQVIGGK